MTTEALQFMNDLVVAGEFAEYLLEHWAKERNIEGLLDLIHRAIEEKGIVLESLKQKGE